MFWLACQQPSCLYTMSPPSGQNGETSEATSLCILYLAPNKIMYSIQIFFPLYFPVNSVFHRKFFSVLTWNDMCKPNMLLSRFSHVRLCVTPYTVAHQAPRPWDSQARTLEWVAISFSNAWKWKVKGKSLSRVWLLATPWTAAYQAPPSMGFSRQEYWSVVPLPSPNWAAVEDICQNLSSSTKLTTGAGEPFILPVNYRKQK